MNVEDQIRNARIALREALDMLSAAGRDDVARAVDRLFLMALPCFVEGCAKNPVQHMAIAARFMVEIMLGEGATADEVKRGSVAALLHDVGQGADRESTRIRSSDIASAPLDEREEWIARAIQARRVHMIEGGRITRRLLAAYNAQFGITFTDADIEEVVRLVEIHDNPSVQEYQGMSRAPSAEVWLFQPDDRLMMFLRSADRLFMVCSAGVAVDLDRDLAKARHEAQAQGLDPDAVRADPARRIRHNIQRHREEAQLYRQVFGEDKAQAYGFRNGLLYRNDTDYAIFLREIQKLEQQYGVGATKDSPPKPAAVRVDNVDLAGWPRNPRDYQLYQMKNQPETEDRAVTLVMGMPLDRPLLDRLEALVKQLGQACSKFPAVRFYPYQGWHMHATLSPVRRTHCTLDLLRGNPAEMTARQQAEIDAWPVDVARIAAAVAETRPFWFRLRPEKLKMTDRGELLLWDRPGDDEQEKELASLRERLRPLVAGRESGPRVHVTLATLGGYQKLSGEQRQQLAAALRGCLQSAGDLGTHFVDRVKLVYYRHRSLSRVFGEKTVELRLRCVGRLAFVNLAGGARNENPRPEEVGKVIASSTAGLVAIGASECMLSGDDHALQVVKAGPCQQAVAVPAVARPAPRNLRFLDDLQDLVAGLGAAWLACLFSHVNSKDHCHPEALDRKWKGPNAVPRLASQFPEHPDVKTLIVHHGTGVLLRPGLSGGASATGVVLRPAGERPEENLQNDPRQYRGGRDTEPRTMTVVRLNFEGQPADIAFCQLGTYSDERRTWQAGESGTRAIAQRLEQIRRICDYFSHALVPVVLIGDFNARPGTDELLRLCRDGFRHVMPADWPCNCPTWGEGYVQGSRRLEPPSHATSERDQRRPYTHLEHGTLIDHVFLRGFDDAWAFSLRVLPLDREAPGERSTDHRPIILSIARP